MWFIMKNGICKYDGKTFTEYTPKDGLGGTEFWGIIIEQSGIIWITARGSTTRFDPSIPVTKSKSVYRIYPDDGLIVVFKVCFKTSQEICGGVLDKDFIDLMANVFIKLSRMDLGSINNRSRQNRMEKNMGRIARTHNKMYKTWLGFSVNL
jgi:hypothetical protein